MVAVASSVARASVASLLYGIASVPASVPGNSVASVAVHSVAVHSVAVHSVAAVPSYELVALDSLASHELVAVACCVS